MTGHVIGLNLGSGGLQGNIHSNSSLFSLGHLKRLDLSENDFRGSPIPSKFGGFVSMTHLDLSYSNFSGPIPSEIPHLSTLVSLNLSQYSFPVVPHVDTLTFNRIVQNLTNLRELVLNEVDMSSIVLDSFKNLSSSLKTLELSDCHLQGKFPESIFHRPNLRLLDLRYNYNLTGYFPESNWSSPLEALRLSSTRISVDWHHLTRNFKSLRDLSLRNCSFVGSYLAFLGNLTQIMRLDLSSNNFGGQIPWSFFLNLESLVYLNLAYNNFVGQFPEVDSNSTSNSSLYDFSKQQLVGPIPRHLTVLILYENQLNGIIPSWLGSLPSLEYLDLRSNQLSGNIIEFQTRSLLWLYLNDNKLDGLIPRSIFELEKLQSLVLSSNQLSGNIIEFQSRSLSMLYLRNNKLDGQIPRSIFELENLDYLDLSSNQLSGNIIEFQSRSLSFLYLNDNKLDGLIPRSIFELEKATELDLSSNNLSGTVEFGSKLQSLRELNLSFNHLSLSFNHLRTWPQLDLLGNFSQSLSVLNLRNNKFHGVIPGTFSEGNVLRNLDLNENQLEESLPQSLLRCRELEVLDLGNNKIQDTFPNWLESLPKLQVLILRSNKFSGEICFPKTKFPFQKMHIIDLSNNRFSGLLPTKYFENLTAMINSQEHGLKYMGGLYYQDTVVLTIKGFEIEMKKILTYFTIIDFSNNTFRGEISSVISKLKSLKGLNFSHNELTGTIPPSFGEMSNLEWLDLSSNKLVGDIPEQLAN
ncbi:PREDICTED: receptor [Prunus dulcis]|uniref:PREDICTED: receptor n=1 Tax=Prunus dulcis TaxID=3755 RepID=A0A5E4G1P1_PRUDU|nr:receptor-like protein 9DC3 [Prunus dulcis]VVA33583.1 PREDICTED: receptor [Prunus dulcis]